MLERSAVVIPRAEVYDDDASEASSDAPGVGGGLPAKKKNARRGARGKPSLLRRAEMVNKAGFPLDHEGVSRRARDRCN